MASWNTPKINWTADDVVNLAIPQMAGSLVYLHDLINANGGDVPTIHNLDVVRVFQHTDFLTAEQFTDMERALYLYSEEAYNLFGLSKVFPSYETYLANGLTPDYERFNAIGRAMIAIYNTLSDRHILPYWLQEVEYIQSSGGAYINTGVAPDDTTRMDLRLFTNCTSNFYCAGAMDSYGKVIFAQDGAANGSLVSATVNSKRTIAANTSGRWARDASGQIYSIRLETRGDSTFYYSVYNRTSNIGYAAERDYGSISSGGANICVFALNDKAVVSGTNRLYYFRLRKGGKLVRNLVPCRDTRTGEVGVFDLVESRFFGSASASAFVAGADVV